MASALVSGRHRRRLQQVRHRRRILGARQDRCNGRPVGPVARGSESLDVAGVSPDEARVAVNSTILTELFDYVGFGIEDARWLARFGPVARPQFGPIVAEFYRTIDRNPNASAVFTGGEQQRQRLHASMHRWLEGIVGGVYDDAYFEQRARIGRVHVRIELDQRYMFAAMTVIRTSLHEVLRGADWPSADRARTHLAIDRICDIELAVMLETYRESYVEKQRAGERLATIGQLAASIGHELRNPLAVMETSLHLIERRTTDEKAVRHIQRMREQLAISGAIISDLLEMARDRPPDRRLITLRALVTEAIDSVPRPDDVQIVVDVPDAMPRVLVDANQMRQLVVNLVLNAAQALASARRAGTVRIDATLDGEALVLTVDDDGPGLTMEAQRRLFEPLFTTRATGVGLGLPLCRRIAEKHGGSIRGINRGDPDQPQGARFEVRIPGVIAPGAVG